VFGSEGLSLGFLLGLFSFNLFFSHVVVQVVAVHRDLDRSSSFIGAFFNIFFFVTGEFVIFISFLLFFVSLNFSVDFLN
jgi:hypothetical protein